MRRTRPLSSPLHCVLAAAVSLTLGGSLLLAQGSGTPATPAVPTPAGSASPATLVPLPAPTAAANAGVPLKWSNSTTAPTPAGGKTLHGPFSNDLITVSAENLPAHEWLDITVELVILRTWDGSVEITDEPTATGPDYFYLGLSGGRPLVYTTFSNLVETDFEEGSRYQNFPSVIPGDRLVARTGAAAKNTLGFDFMRSTGTNYKMDTTYRINVLVPHKEGKATLELSAMNLQELDDEGWGVLSVQVQPLAGSAVPVPAEEAIAAAFASAVKPTAADPMTDFRTLVAGRDRTVAWITKNVTATPVKEAEVAANIRKLAEPANDIEVVDGRGKLLEMGHAVEVPLRDAYRTATEHSRPRLDSALQVLGVTAVSDDGVRRVLLATRVLEIIGTPEAMALRKKLAVQ